MAVTITLNIRLQPDRRRLAQGVLNMIECALRSDAKKAASGRSYLPIFDVTNAALMTAIGDVQSALQDALNPEPRVVVIQP